MITPFLTLAGIPEIVVILCGALVTLRRDLQARAGQVDRDGARPAMLKQLFEYYVDDLQARGRSGHSVSRAASTARVVERLLPAMLALPLSKLQARDFFAFRQTRERDGTKPSSLNRDLQSLRTMMRAARPDFQVSGRRVPDGRHLARPVAHAR